MRKEIGSQARKWIFSSVVRSAVSENTRSKLAVILAPDVVGSCRVTDADEGETPKHP